MTNRFALCLKAGTVVLAVSLSTLCLAQSTNTRNVVTVTQVKPEMLNEWMDLQKNELNPVLKKLGITRRAVSRPVYGNSYEFVSISPLEKFAVMDDADAFNRAAGSAQASARLSEKARKCITGSHTFVTTTLGDLSNPPDLKDPPAITVSTRVRVAPGKTEDYQALIKNEILPAYKKGKVFFTASRRSLGANSNDIVLTTYYDKFADLDAGPALTRLLGTEGSAKVLAKTVGLGTLVEQVVRRRVADLSY